MNLAKIITPYYNPFYVTYRGKGSRENTGAFCPSQKTGFTLRGLNGPNVFYATTDIAKGD